MRIKSLVLCLGFISSVAAVDFETKKITLDIGGATIFNIFGTEPTKAFVDGTLIFSEEPGDYTVEIIKKKKPFRDGTNTIKYTLGDNPEFDTENCTFTFTITKEDISKSIRLNIILPDGIVLPPGTYTSKFNYKIFKEKKRVKRDKLFITFVVEEQLEAKVIIDGEEREKNAVIVNFGEIEGEVTKNICLSIKSNKNVNLSAYSTNNGKMLLSGEGEEALTSCLIPYSLEKDGKKIEVTSTPTVVTADIVPNITSILSNINIKIAPEVDKNFAGAYEDRLVFSVSSS